MNFTEEEMERGDYLYDARRDAKVERAMNNNRPEDGRILDELRQLVITDHSKHNTTMNTETIQPGTIGYKAIHRQVLIVARARHEGTWRAYVTPVPGKNHEEELRRWREHGSQMTEAEARPFFPQLKDLPYAR